MKSPENPSPDARPDTFAAYFEAIRLNVEELKTCIRSNLADSLNDDDGADYVFECASHLKNIEKAENALASCKQVFIRAGVDIVGFDFGDAQRDKSGLRRIEAEVTEGMLNQSMLSLTAAKKKGLIAKGERLKVSLPNGTVFETEIVGTGNRFQERGLVRAFYESESIQPGDFVSLLEVSPGEWTLRKGHCLDISEFLAAGPTIASAKISNEEGGSAS